MGELINIEPIIRAHKELAELEPKLKNLFYEVNVILSTFDPPDINIHNPTDEHPSLWAYYLREWNKLSDLVVDLLMEVDDLERHSAWQRCNDLSNSFMPLLEREKWIG